LEEEKTAAKEVEVSFGFVCRGLVKDFEALENLIRKYFREQGRPRARLIKPMGSSHPLFLVSQNYLNQQYEEDEKNEQKDGRR